MIIKKTKASQKWPAIGEDYFSGCIANLGVVPLVLFAAFLLLPIFFSLLALFVFVTRVFETIIQLLTYSIQLKRICYLSLIFLIVKVVITFPSYAAEQSVSLAIGGQKEISVGNLANFSIGNKQVAGARYNSQSKTLLIKGKKLGHTQILVWKKDRSMLTYSIFIIDKRSQLKVYQIAEGLEKAAIEHQVQGHQIIIEGKIDNFEKYQFLQKVYKENKSAFQIRTTIGRKLQNEIILDIYQYFLNEYVDDIFCDFEKIQVICSYFIDAGISKDSLKYLKQKYNVQFIKNKYSFPLDNFKIKLKIIALERNDGNEINIGLDKLSSNIKDLFKNGLISFVNSNEAYFSENNLKASTLAEPELIVKNNSYSKIQVGKEILYEQNNKDTTNHTWKFAGLKIKLKVFSKGKKLFLDYDNEFTTPSGSSITGSKEKSILRVEFNKPIKLFEIGLSSSSESNSAIPFFNKIPIFGKLISKSHISNTYKRIIAYVSITQ